MKINEIVQEGKFLNAVKGFIPGTAANTVKKSAKQQNVVANNVAKKLLQNWSAVQANLQASGQPPTPQHVAQWFSKFAGSPVNSEPANMDASSISDWLTTEVNRYMASKAMGAPTQPPAPKTQAEPTQTEPVQQEPVKPAQPTVKNKPWTIKTPKATVTRDNEGIWTTQDGLAVEDPADLRKLEYYAGLGVEDVAAYQAQSAEKDAVIRQQAADREKAATVDTTPTAAAEPQEEPAKQHTGGRQKGGLSQTANAIRQRDQRAAKKAAASDMPAVFKSNRPQPSVNPQAQPSITDLVRQRQAKGMTE